WVGAIGIQGSAQRIPQSGNRKVRFRGSGVPAAESTVHMAIGVYEEPGPGEVIIEVKDIQIDAARIGDADEDKPLLHAGDLFVETNNLLVEAFAVLSPFTSKHDEERLSSPSRFGA